MSTIPDETRAKLQALRTEFEHAAIKRAPGAWSRLSLPMRSVLLLVAGVDAAQDQELATLALRDWREFTPPERAAVASCVRALREELNNVRDDLSY